MEEFREVRCDVGESRGEDVPQVLQQDGAIVRHVAFEGVDDVSRMTHYVTSAQ